MFKKLFGKCKKTPEKSGYHPVAFDALLEKAFHHAQALAQGHMATWKQDQAERFDLDLETGKIWWTFGDGGIATADASLIDTWAPQSESFLWGWDHPMCPPADNGAALIVRQYAEDHDIDLLKLRQVECPEDDAWQLSAIAVLLGDLQGVYRAPAGGGSVAFIGFGTVSLSKTLA